MRRVSRGDARPAARPHGQGHLRDRRPLPAHERAAVDRRARRLHRRLPAPRGPVRPRERRPGADADDRRPRPGRRLPPDLVAGRPRSQGRSARQEGRGASADPGPPVPLLPGPHRRRPDRGRDPGADRVARLSSRRGPAWPAPGPPPARSASSPRPSPPPAAAACADIRVDDLARLRRVVGQAQQVDVRGGDRGLRQERLADPVDQPVQ